MYRLIVVVLLLFTAEQGPGQEVPVMTPGPKSPAESLKCIKARPGFVVELMAAEPLVQDPIAFAWGPDGKLWVVEMGDYPLGVDGKNKPGGRIKFLEKSKASDGPYDKATVFLDNLGYPTGVTPWGKGVLVTCAPDIFYAEDTDGDGKADKKVILYTGFREGNQQHRVNGLVRGLDNWLYGANGDSGGVVKSLKTGAKVDISGRDFRIKPHEGLIEAVTGQTQFGRARDDWGNWFGNNNSNPMYHYVLEDHYLKRNPFLAPPEPRVNVSETPGAARVYPISKPLPRFNSPESANHFTSACSAIVYRDNLYGPEFENNTFVSEPVHNLVHREIMTPKGMTFTSKRAKDEQESEFLASSDNWFRPTTIQTGPDGALWIADMYRYVIEHPEWIPKDWQKKLDLRAGHDKGRIYRIFPKDTKPRPIPRLDRMNTTELAAALDHPNGWQRDMAQQLLLARNDKDAPDELLRLFKRSKNPLARLHALMTLHGLDWRNDSIVSSAISDEHPGVRRHAVFCAGVYLRNVQDMQAPSKGTLQIRDLLYRTLSRALEDKDPQVLLQLAYSLGEFDYPDTGSLLGKLARRHANDRYLLAAVLSSLNKNNFDQMVERVHADCEAAGERLPMDLLRPLLRLAPKLGSAANSKLLMTAAISGANSITPSDYEGLAAALDALEENGLPLTKLAEGDALSKRVEALLASARKTVGDSTIRADERIAAVRLLGRKGEGHVDDLRLIAELLTPQTPGDVQAAAVTSLARSGDSDAPRFLLKGWKGHAPSVRSQILDALLSRGEWAHALVHHLELGRVQASDIDAVRRQRLLDHKDARIRDLAKKIFAGAVNTDRQKLVESYRPALSLKSDGARGQKLFAKHCAACHKLGGIGEQVGPDLASVGDKSPEGLLIAILDPNRAVEPRYIAYLAVTKTGLTLNGLLASETSASITLVGADGKKHDILRIDLEELASTGKSAMPEGIEKELPHQDMADLIAFVRGQLPEPKAKQFAGNKPAVIIADKRGALELLPSNGAIFGKTLVLEEKYGNLGYWSSADDHVVWTVEVPKAGKFAVEMEWACANDSAGNHFVLKAAGEKLTARVVGTGSWDDYRKAVIGAINLPAGRVAIRMSPLDRVHGALIDLKAIRLMPRADKP